MSGEEGLPINGTVLALILIFIPGIVCYGIVAALAPKKERENLAVALQMFLYGIVSYMILYLLQRVFRELAQYIHINSIKLLDPSKISDTPIDPIAIMAATVIGVLLGLLVTLNLEYNILMKTCRKCRVTRRFGDNDTWDLIQNSKDTNNWVTIRDEEHKRMYQGWVGAFSTGGEPRALVLERVIVYDAGTGQALGAEVPFLYMSFDDGALSIEFGKK